jgi:hypothetical protein
MKPLTHSKQRIIMGIVTLSILILFGPLQLITGIQLLGDNVVLSIVLIGLFLISVLLSRIGKK